VPGGLLARALPAGNSGGNSSDNRSDNRSDNHVSNSVSNSGVQHVVPLWWRMLVAPA